MKNKLTKNIYQCGTCVNFSQLWSSCAANYGTFYAKDIEEDCQSYRDKMDYIAASMGGLDDKP